MKRSNKYWFPLLFCVTMSFVLTSCSKDKADNDLGFAPKNVSGKTLNFSMYSIKFSSNTSAKIRAQVETNTYNVTYSSIEYKKTGNNSAILIFNDVVVHYPGYYDGSESLRVENGTHSFSFTSENSGLYGGDTDYYFIDSNGGNRKDYHWSSANQWPFSIY